MLAAFVRSLEAEAPLPKDARAALLRLKVRKLEILSGRDLPGNGDIALVERGLLARCVPHANGSRAVVGLYVEGECYGLDKLIKSTNDHVVALGTSTINLVSANELRSLATKFPSLTIALWRRSLTDLEVARQWIVSLGHRDAKARAAHLFCELLGRHEAREHVEQHSFSFPMTQSELANIFGLSVVHVNRILKQLRDEGVVDISRKRLHIKSRSRLLELANIDPSYPGAETPRHRAHFPLSPAASMDSREGAAQAFS